MCGISGLLTNHITEQHQRIIASIIQNQTPRGPDHADTILIKSEHSHVMLGHNRLSIIDLSTAAHQPMWDHSKRYCISYNGEIYNYLELKSTLEQHGLLFQTESDTEVILNAFAHWGIACLDYFQGPFAFALFDKQTAELWLCRDRFGVRPLYYSRTADTFYFASTKTTLAKALRLKPNLTYLSQGINYLVYEDNTEMTAYEKLFSLPAGTYLQVKYHQQQWVHNIKRYYDLTKNVNHLISTLPIDNIDYLTAQVNDHFSDAVKIRLRTDVPLAISLSGGLDSSSVAAYVKNQHEHTIGFSFSNPNERYSEGPLVADCAKHLNIKMQYVWPSYNEMLAAFDKTLAAQEAPFSSLSVVAQYLLYESVHAHGIKVLLGGQGGDEVFMGYKKFLLFSIQHLVKKKSYLTAFKKSLNLLPMVFSELHGMKSYWQHRHRYLQQKTIASHLLQSSEMPELNLKNQHPDLRTRQLQDITHFSLPTLLRYEDRNAMSNSVESRLPYLDHRLVELGLALPECMKLHSGYGKWIIRKMCEHKIPDNIRLARYKRGFDISLPTFLKAGLGSNLREKLHDHKDKLHPYLKHPLKIDQHFSDQQLKRTHHTFSEAITLLWLTKVIA